MRGRVAAIVLAAGQARRFGGGKLRATIDGRPILQHVLDSLTSAGIPDPIVVVDPRSGVDPAVDWSLTRRVDNEDPGRGLATSLRLGWAAALEDAPDVVAVVVVLGDQPLLDPGVVRTMVAAPLDPHRPVIIARHADGARNPVRLELEAAPLVAAAAGDRGLGAMLDARPDLVRSIEVEVGNPDIDSRSDLAALLVERWSARVEGNAEQVDRMREAPDGCDFYATVSRTFVADPGREDDPVLHAVLARARPDDRWLDIGAGAGRYALPVARRVRRVVAVDPSDSMLRALTASMAADGVTNIDVLAGRWPPDTALRDSLGPDPIADVALIAHVGYDVAGIGPFLDALEGAAGRECIAVLMAESPASIAAPFWPIVHGEERVPLPALAQFTELLEARGSAPRVLRVKGERRRWTDREELLGFLRRQLWTVPDSPADSRLVEAVDGTAAAGADGTLQLPGAEPLDIGVVTWSPVESR